MISYFTLSATKATCLPKPPYANGIGTDRSADDRTDISDRKILAVDLAPDKIYERVNFLLRAVGMGDIECLIFLTHDVPSVRHGNP